MRRMRFRARIFSAVALAVAAGCQNQVSPAWDRVNHPFDASKLKTSQDATDHYDEFTGGESGFSGQLENNLKTTAQLEAGANAVRADLDDKLRAYLSTDITWRGLRSQVYADLGVPAGLVGNVVIEPEYEVSERVQLRQLKLGAVIRALALLGEAQGAVLKRALTDSTKASKDLADAQKQVDEASKQGSVNAFPTAPAKSSPATAAQKNALQDQNKALDDLRCKRVQWVLNLTAAFESVATQIKQNQALLDTATDLQKRLLGSINDSADPGASKALIAVLGTGLGDDDFSLLDDYLDKLNEELAKIDPPAEAPAPTTFKPTIAAAGAGGTAGAGPGAGGADRASGTDAANEPALTEDQTWQLLKPSLLETQLLLYVANAAGKARVELINTRDAKDPLRMKRELESKARSSVGARSGATLPASVETPGTILPASVETPGPTLAATLGATGAAPAQITARLAEAKKEVADFDPYQIKQAKARIVQQSHAASTRPATKQLKALPDKAGTFRQTDKNGKVKAYYNVPDLKNLQMTKKPATDDQGYRRFFTTVKAVAPKITIPTTPPASTTVPANNAQPANAGDRANAAQAAIAADVAKATQPAPSPAPSQSLTHMISLTSRVETLLDQLNLHSGADVLKLATDRADIAIDTLDKLSNDLTTITKGDSTGYVALLGTAFKAQGDIAKPGSCPTTAPASGNGATALGRNEASALGLFQLILRANPKLTLQFGKLLDVTNKADYTAYSDALNKIGSIVNDGMSQALSARVRIQQYIEDLTKVQADVAQENARHTQTMLTLAKMEAARWELTGDLLDQYSVIYDPVQWLKNPNEPINGDTSGLDVRDTTTDENWVLTNIDRPDPHHPMVETWRIRLFPDELQPYTSERDAFKAINASFSENQSDVLDKTQVLGKKGDTDHDTFTASHPLVKEHPFISRDDSVVASIRKLADTVRAFHTGDQQANDPLGWNLTRSNIRLQRAVALLDGTMLLLSANEQSARDNATRLENEVSLHSLRLDAYERRTYEAGYRLTLGDIKAFHSTGFTDKDLQVLETAALTAIGVRIGH